MTKMEVPKVNRLGGGKKKREWFLVGSVSVTSSGPRSWVVSVTYSRTFVDPGDVNRDRGLLRTFRID